MEGFFGKVNFLKLTVLGSGSCVIEQNHRASSGYILEIAGKVMMVDTGTGSTGNIPDTDYSVQDIDVVINTHRHPDHISDLVPVLQDKVVRSFSTEEGRVTLYGPEGHVEYLEDRMFHEMLEKPSEIKEKFGFTVDIHEIEDEQSIAEDLLMSSVEALHGPEKFKCLSLKFESEGESVVFTGDTDYNPQLEDFAEGADLLITDCSRPADEQVEGHMNVEECARLAERAGVDTLVLSHLYPRAEKEDLNSQTKGIFDGEVLVAEDGMVFTT